MLTLHTLPTFGENQIMVGPVTPGGGTYLPCGDSGPEPPHDGYVPLRGHVCKTRRKKCPMCSGTMPGSPGRANGPGLPGRSAGRVRSALGQRDSTRPACRGAGRLVFSSAASNPTGGRRPEGTLGQGMVASLLLDQFSGTLAILL